MTQTLTAGQVILRALHEDDADRPRSKQEEIGFSALGGCARAVWFQINKYPQTNFDIDNLEAIMGTAIHTVTQKALDRYSFGTYQTEVTLYSDEDGIGGHADWYWEEELEMVDLKTGKKKNAHKFPKQGHIWQVMNYAREKIKEGKRVEWVTLVMLMRDGRSTDVMEYRVPYDEKIALEGLAWLDAIRKSKEAPEPDRPPEVFCKIYCPFFGENCQGAVFTKKGRW